MFAGSNRAAPFHQLITACYQIDAGRPSTENDLFCTMSVTNAYRHIAQAFYQANRFVGYCILQ